MPLRFSSSELAQMRAGTPSVTHRIHLNHASSSLMPVPVTRAMSDFIALEQAIGTHAALEARAGEIEAVRRDVADLIGSQPRNIAFLDTATRGWALALGAAIASGTRRIAIARNDWGANILNATAFAQAGGLEVALVATSPLGEASAEALAEAGAGGAAAYSLVPTASGVANPSEAIAAAARARDALVMVDAAQAVGQMPVDVSALGADVLVFPARKWLRGPKGAAVLFVSDRLLGAAGPPLLDLGGVSWTGERTHRWREDARRFESFDFNPATRLGLGAAARLASELDPARIAERIRALVVHACERIMEAGAPLPLEAGNPAATGMLTWSDARIDVAAVVAALRMQGVLAAEITAGQARLGNEARGGGSVLRVAVHYFNTEDEVEAFAARFASLWRPEGRRPS